MRGFQSDPSGKLEAVFSAVAERAMAGLPIVNPALAVEAVGFRKIATGPWGCWLGALVTPWAINLLCLPAEDLPWPAAAAGSKHGWRFPSGEYEFIVAEEASLGVYHLCSLFSPTLEFDGQAAARLVAQAALEALLAAPGSSGNPAAARRAFLGLRP